MRGMRRDNSGHLGFALDIQEPFRVVGRMCADMFDAASPVVAKKVESQTITFRIDLSDDLVPEGNELREVQRTLKDRLLHTLPVITAGARQPRRWLHRK